MKIVLPLLALAASQDPMRLYDALREHDAQGELAALVALEAFESGLVEGERDTWLDMLATRLTFVHDVRGAVELDSSLYGDRAARHEPSREGYSPA